MPKVTNNFELSKTFLNLFRLGKMGKKRVDLLTLGVHYFPVRENLSVEIELHTALAFNKNAALFILFFKPNFSR